MSGKKKNRKSEAREQDAEALHAPPQEAPAAPVITNHRRWRPWRKITIPEAIITGFCTVLAAWMTCHWAAGNGTRGTPISEPPVAKSPEKAIDSGTARADKDTAADLDSLAGSKQNQALQEPDHAKKFALLGEALQLLEQELRIWEKLGNAEAARNVRDSIAGTLQKLGRQADADAMLAKNR
jgi:hypothetical protein